MTIDIDPNSGFCFGVTRAIEMAEEVLATGATLHCLGDIVHNERECQRLRDIGLLTIDHCEMKRLSAATVLLRAHGEPPSTYAVAQRQGITIVDATCPVVLKLQERIRRDYLDDTHHQRQIAIFGKRGHAEVLGLEGQTDGTAIVIEGPDEAIRLDPHRPVSLYSQTTQSRNGLLSVAEAIRHHIGEDMDLQCYDTICRQVERRMAAMEDFARRHDVILFVAGQKSSNGKVLFQRCRQANPHTHIVDSPEDIRPEWLEGARSVGISGATSTPKWLMEQCAAALRGK